MNSFQKTFAASSAILAAILIPSFAQAQSIPADLTKMLEKKFGERQNIIVKVDPEGKHEKGQVGPYIYVDYFNLANASPLGGAAKRVRKFCVKEKKGTWTQLAQIVPDQTLEPATLTIAGDAKTRTFTANEILNVLNASSWPESHAKKYEKLSRENKLGVFSCNDPENQPYWTIAIIPNVDYRTKTGLAGETLYKKAIAIQPMVISEMENTLVAVRQYKAYANAKEEKEKQEKANARESYVATLDVGTETNCGMIIGKRGEIFEIDLKSHLARASGKSTAWVKADKLESKWKHCYLN